MAKEPPTRAPLIAPADAQRLPDDLPALAFETAKALTERLGIDGAFVMVYRKGDGMLGAASVPKDASVTIEDLFANTIKAALDTRGNAIVAALARQKGGD